MEIDNHEFLLKRVFGHWEVYVDGVFFCSADSQLEAVKELYEAYK